MARTREGLLAAVLQAPGDDAPRLRLADWLAMQDDPRGELIHVQVALARGASADDARAGADAANGPSEREDADDDARDALARRERTLLAQHERGWIGPHAEWLVDWTFRRGFPDEIVARADAFVAYGDDLLRQAPVQS